ncbi:MAG: AAA family ATPase [Gemmatimonadaceae bacterium]|nr:AAA family ATPase [Gloeobacterales cyanobacterium ES-bin-141]
MAASSLFPQHLLDATLRERVGYFKNCTVAHHLLKEALESLKEILVAEEVPPLVFLIGPTGAGKTTLLLQLSKILAEAHAKDPGLDPSRIPAVTVEARGPDSGNFSWKDYYVEVLKSLKDAFWEHKLHHRPVPSASVATAVGAVERSRSTRSSTSELRAEMEETVKARGVVALLVDEAQHFTKMASGRKWNDQMDAIKSMARFTGTVHVLFGTYELLSLVDLSGQLARRSVEVHLPRYRAEYFDDRKEFKRVLEAFARQMPLSQQPNFEPMWQYLYERTIGCVGTLKDWLVRALGTAIKEEALTLKLEHLKKHELPIPKCLLMLEEAAVGENKMSVRPGADMDLYQKLGLDKEPSQTALKTNKDKPKSKGRRVSSPGSRNATRDPVGGQKDV